VSGGVSYALRHRGQPFACLLRDPNFWRAVAVGAVGGTVSGFVAGFFAPLMLLSSGVGTAMQIGGFIGMLSSFCGHVVTNVLNGRPAAEGVGWAMLSGAVFGALGGALGYGVRQWSSRSNSSTIPASRVRFTQDSIGPNTKVGVPLDVLTQEIDNGYFRGTLRVVKFGGKFYSLDNRRLAAFKLLNHDVPVTLVSLDDPGILGEFTRKFTTINDGLSIIVRGTDLVIK
jgi:hypothetical protein